MSKGIEFIQKNTQETLDRQVRYRDQCPKGSAWWNAYDQGRFVAQTILTAIGVGRTIDKHPSSIEEEYH